MTNETLKGILIAINDAWGNFTIPQTTAILNIWKKNLGQYDEKTIMQAIEELYKTENFFSFAKLTDLLQVSNTPQLPEPSEIVAIIRRLASNSGQDISGQPEHIREVVRLMGGLPSIGRKQWDQWLEKDILRVYGEWMNSQKKRQELLKLGTVKSIG